MPDFVLSRFLTVGCLVTVFAVMTVLAHRTKVHAHWIRVIGLGVSCALLASAWWINTPSFEMAAFPAQAFSLILFVALGVFYAAAVMRSQSVVRWARISCMSIGGHWLSDGRHFGFSHNRCCL